MSNDKIDPNKKDTTISSADDLVKTTKTSDVELSEEELKRVTGGKPSVSEIVITKENDKASTNLF